MPRSRLTIWPTVEQRQWVERRSKERGLPLTTVIQLLLEEAMINEARFRLLLAEAEADEQQGPHAQP
jgi:hypothetical protein